MGEVAARFDRASKGEAIGRFIRGFIGGLVGRT
jgi:hypothetical protein